MVITVMINSPWQADDDADSQSGDNRGDSAHTSISLTVPPASLQILQSGCQPYARTAASARQWSPDIAATVDCLTDITRSIIGKAPRSPICCNATASWLFGEKSFRPTACGRHPTSGKEAGSVRRLLIWVLGLAWQVCEGDRVIDTAYNDVITMISVLTSVISSLRPRQHIEERLTLIIDFYHLLLRLF